MVRRCLLALWVWVVAGPAGAIITASLNQTNGTVDDRFILTIEVIGDSDDKPKPGPVPGLSFQLFNQSQSSRYDLLRGQSEVQVTYQYYIGVKKPGSYSIPAVKLKVDGKIEETAPLKFRAQAAKAASREDAAEVFVERELDRSKIYRGETIRSRLRIYMRVNVREAENATDLGAQFEVLRAKEQKSYDTTVAGYQYRVKELVEVIRPLRTGKLDLAPVVLQVVTELPRQRPRRRSPLDFFGSDVRLKRLIVRSKPQTVDVLPLPQAGRPKDFSGLVGAFQLEGKLSQSQAKVGDNITLTLELTGQGSVDEVEDLAIQWPDGLKVYPDKPIGKSMIDWERGLIGKKVFTYALVPTKPGSYELDKLNLNMFSPQLSQYVELAVDLASLEVGGQASELVTNAAEPRRRRVKVIDEDIIGLKRGPVAARSAVLSGNQVVFLGLLSVAPGLLFLGAWLASILRRRDSGRDARRRQSRAFSQLKGELQNAKDIEALSTAFRVYFGDRYAKRGSALTGKEIIRILESRGLGADTRAAVQDVLDTCNTYSYGAGGGDGDAVASLKERAIHVAREVEKHA